MLTKQEVVHLVGGGIFVGSQDETFVAEVLLLFQLLVGLHQGVLSRGFVLSEVLCGLDSLVNVRAQIVRCCKLKDVRVEGGHLGLNVIEKVSLLHVTTLDFYWNLLEKL